MTAEEFLQSSLEGSKITAFRIERTEQYRELWTTNEHPELDGYGLLHLLSSLQSKGFIFEFTDMDSIKITAPHFVHHSTMRRVSIDGWSCQVEHDQSFCELIF